MLINYQVIFLIIFILCLKNFEQLDLSRLIEKEFLLI